MKIKTLVAVSGWTVRLKDGEQQKRHPISILALMDDGETILPVRVNGDDKKTLETIPLGDFLEVIPPTD